MTELMQPDELQTAEPSAPPVTELEQHHFYLGSFNFEVKYFSGCVTSPYITLEMTGTLDNKPVIIFVDLDFKTMNQLFRAFSETKGAWEQEGDAFDPD